MKTTKDERTIMDGCRIHKHPSELDDGRDRGGRVKRMEKLLRKKELIEAVGVAKSTISDWIIEFHMYIPTVKQGAVTYYRPETINVLNVIKELRQDGYAKPQILELLGRRGFPITVEEASEDIQKIVSQADARDTLINVMQGMSIAVTEIGKQTDRLNQHELQLSRQTERIEGQDERINELERTLIELKRELLVTQEELAATKEQTKKSLWKRVFGK